jgi:crotonobetainyl-CoA:carnitine CoA-transferase CaiB-like acyl-CoA transferase
MTGPLDGIRVVEAGSFLALPFAAMMLADMGADVIKVEPPPRGDPFRSFGRRVGGQSVVFTNCNRNKRSVTFDLTDPDGRTQFHELVHDADVLLTNWRPGVAGRLGLDDELVRREHPRLVWVRLTGFGNTGPLANTPAFDGLVQARTGLAAPPDRDAEPQLIPSWIVDKATAGFVAQAALAGIIGRGATGTGSSVDVALLDAMSYFNFPDLMAERTLVSDTEPVANRQLRALRPLRCQDGWLLVNPVTRGQFVAALNAFACPDEAEGIFELGPGSLAERFYAVVEKICPERTVANWLRLLADNDVPAAPILDFDEHLSDPQVVNNEIYFEIDDPTLGPIRQARHPARSTLGTGGMTSAPGYNEHAGATWRPRPNGADHVATTRVEES